MSDDTPVVMISKRAMRVSHLPNSFTNDHHPGHVLAYPNISDWSTEALWAGERPTENFKS